jgi:putative transposase
MRYSSSENMGIIRVVKNSELSTRHTLKELGIHLGNFYNWYRRYLEDVVGGLEAKKTKARTFWDKVPEEIKEQVIDEALEQTELSPEKWIAMSLTRKSTSSQSLAFIGF